MVGCDGRPRLFVYDLPVRYRDDTEGGFGSPASPHIPPLPHLADGVRLWRTGEFALGDLFLRRAQAYRCRTDDASRADLFFVPAFSSRQHNRPTERTAESGHLGALLRRLRRVRVYGSRCAGGGDTNCSALEARGGADHIFINPRNGAPFERHPYAELDYMDPRWGNATLLDLMEPGDWPWFGNYQPEGRYHSVPHPSLVHLEPGVSQPPWRSRHARRALVVGAFGFGHGPKPVQKLRMMLKQACDAASDAQCTFLQLGATDRRGGRGGANRTAGATEEPVWHATARLYWDGTFCMQPPGDAVSRKAIVDSLLLGCIPVLFHEGQAGQWPWHWGGWHSNASVLLNMAHINDGRLDPIAALAAIPPSRVATMRDTIAAHAHVMQYAAVDTSELSPPSQRSSWRLFDGSAPQKDAFDVALDGAWVRATDADTIAAGTRTQQTDGAALDAAVALFDHEPFLGSWGGRSSGTCARTWGVPGDCIRGTSGTWRLGPETGIVSIDDCCERCRACARCQWVSYSMTHAQCDWYSQCNTSKLNRRFGGETFRTRQVLK